MERIFNNSPLESGDKYNTKLYHMLSKVYKWYKGKKDGKYLSSCEVDHDRPA